jgi:hypothetical protein
VVKKTSVAVGIKGTGDTKEIEGWYYVLRRGGDIRTYIRCLSPARKHRGIRISLDRKINGGIV